MTSVRCEPPNLGKGSHSRFARSRRQPFVGNCPIHCIAARGKRNGDEHQCGSACRSETSPARLRLRASMRRADRSPTGHVPPTPKWSAHDLRPQRWVAIASQARGPRRCAMADCRNDSSSSPPARGDVLAKRVSADAFVRTLLVITPSILRGPCSRNPVRSNRGMALVSKVDRSG